MRKLNDFDYVTNAQRPTLAELHEAVTIAQAFLGAAEQARQEELDLVYERYAEELASAEAAYGQAYARLRAHPQYVPED